MSEIDRRALLGSVVGAGLIGGVAGAGLTLVGSRQCTGSPSAGGKGELITEGYCEHHGDPPSTPKAFTPEEMCVVYIKFDGSPAPSVTQGYIDNLQQTDDPYLETLANAALKELAGSGDSTVTFYTKRYNFNLFSFRGPTKVVIFVDNLDTKIRFCEEIPGTKSDHAIRFTAFTGLSSIAHVPSFRPTKYNKNFYGLDRVKIDGLAGPAAYWLNFLNRHDITNRQLRNVDHSDFQKWWTYSMNIHLLMKSPDNTVWMPLVLDPDTGNMGSNP
jgi:hypothetical protein